MIGMFLPAEDVGYYRAAYNIVSAISGLISIPAVMFPVFVQIEEENLGKAFNKAFKYTIILCFPAIISTVIFGKMFIIFVYGFEYLPALEVLYILSALILGSSFGFWNVLFNAKEKPEYPISVSFVSMIINIILNYFLILKLGIVGAALATVISNALSWTVLGILSKRFLGIFPDFKDMLRPSISAVASLTPVLFLKPDTMFEALTVFALSVFIYFLILLATKEITKEDYKYVREILILK